MATVEVEIVGVIDEDFPGWVECHLTDANDQVHVFREKIPVVIDSALDALANFPRKGVIRCTVLEMQSDVLVIDTELPDGVESISGITRFAVSPDQITGVEP